MHRDKDDKDICSIIVVSNCIGGSLVLEELGLVLDLQNGDHVMFKSSQITHFNLHFEGLRSSLVFHTDGAADAWTNDENPRNGWAVNKYFRST